MNYYDYLCRCRPVAGLMRSLAAKGALRPERSPDGSMKMAVSTAGLSPDESKLLFSALRPPDGRAVHSLDDLSLEASVELYTAARVFLEGPKVFRPTAADCLALEEVEVSVSAADYAQPFPTFVVEFPRDYALARETAGEDYLRRGSVYRPVAATVRHEAALGVTFCSVITDDASGMVLVGLMGATLGAPLEEDLNKLLSTSRVLPGEEALQRRCTRVALNACLLLTAGGFRRVGHAVNERHVERLRRRNSAADRLELALVPEVYAFSQDVDVRRAVGPAEAAETTPSGRKVCAHWRRSHWRMAPCGRGRLERRRVLIPHTMVHRDQFLGADAATAYVAR